MIQYSLVCDECKKKGIATECQHKINLLPPWKSESRQRLVKFLLGNSQDMFLTEAMGEVASSKSRCFTEDVVNDVFLHPLSVQPAMHKTFTVFIAIDPTSGVRSELAVVSMFYDSDKRLVVRCKWLVRWAQRPLASKGYRPRPLRLSVICVINHFRSCSFTFS